MSEPLPDNSQMTNIKTPVASLDKHGKAKTGLKQEFEHYREQQKAIKAEDKKNDAVQAQLEEAEEELSVQDEETENRLDFSAWNWWNNARVMVGKSGSTKKHIEHS
jgi:hypothetical protein